jgi:hypothetical protein
MNEKDHWFYYNVPGTGQDPFTREGAFDVQEVHWVEASKRGDGPKVYTIYLRTFANNAIKLDAYNWERFKSFYDKWQKQLDGSTHQPPPPPDPATWADPGPITVTH